MTVLIYSHKTKNITNMAYIEQGKIENWIECINYRIDKWIVRWGEHEGAGGTEHVAETFRPRPTAEVIRQRVEEWINGRTAERIRSGFRWRGMPVWLSQENQLNYKAAYDLAVQTDGATLPVIFKFGTEQPVYHTFDNLADLTDFYTSAVRHVQDTLETGWREKNEVDYGMYI